MEDESSMLFPESRIEIESDFQSSIRQPMDE